MQTHDVTSMVQLETAARTLLATCATDAAAGATVLALSGDLGTGKTTFVQTLARQLGIVETVTSPTFAIMKRYEATHPTWRSLVHIDAYRIESIDEMEVLRFREVLEENSTMICIEWPERIQALVPEHAIMLSFELAPDGSRMLAITDEHAEKN